MKQNGGRTADSPRTRIVCVIRDPSLGRAVSAVLSTAGFVPMATDSGGVLDALSSQTPPGAVILSKDAGVDRILGRIRGRHARVPVVVLAGALARQDRAALSLLGADELILAADVAVELVPFLRARLGLERPPEVLAPLPEAPAPPPRAAEPLPDRSALRSHLAQLRDREAHAVLGVPKGAGVLAVRKAFLSAVKRWHPSRFALEPSDVKRLASEIFLTVKRAHDTLLAPQRADRERPSRQ